LRHVSFVISICPGPTPPRSRSCFLLPSSFSWHFFPPFPFTSMSHRRKSKITCLKLSCIPFHHVPTIFPPPMQRAETLLNFLPPTQFRLLLCNSETIVRLQSSSLLIINSQTDSFFFPHFFYLQHQKLITHGLVIINILASPLKQVSSSPPSPLTEELQIPYFIFHQTLTAPRYPFCL